MPAFTVLLKLSCVLVTTCWQEGSAGTQVQGVRPRQERLHHVRWSVAHSPESAVQLSSWKSRNTAEEIRQRRQRKVGHRGIRWFLRRGQSYVCFPARSFLCRTQKGL